MRFLLDEMFPPSTAGRLREEFGHDAVHAGEVGLSATADATLAAYARAQGRALVTENVADFAGERDLVLLFARKRALPAGGGQATALAKLLDRWAGEHPQPYLGPHWPA